MCTKPAGPPDQRVDMASSGAYRRVQSTWELVHCVGVGVIEMLSTQLKEDNTLQRRDDLNKLVDSLAVNTNYTSTKVIVIVI